MSKSIEEQIEDLGKKQLNKIKYYTKTEIINKEIENALKKFPSKSGGIGSNYPDIKTFIQTKDMRKIPVMIEVKGLKGSLVKFNNKGEIDNKKADGTPNYNNINKYAVNGAIHYANAIIENTKSYKEVIAIGFNGYYEGNKIKTQLGVYYVSADNFSIPKEIEQYSDLSFLLPENIENFISKINDINLTEEEKEKKAKEYENDIEIKLKRLNQKMQDDLKISVGSRVELITGMIMAGLGVENKVAPLDITDLKGELGNKSNDGITIINKIESFLSERNLPIEKKHMIINDLSRVFIYSDLWKPINGESKLKNVYISVKEDIMPVFTSAKHLDFTGKLFNILNAWVDIPDSDKNDVVLTPRYVTELMAKLAEVNKDSYVWDYAVGSAGFLISSMKLMIKDAEKRIKSPKELNKKISKIKRDQLLGVEKRSDIYLLAVLNMILMGDGSSNIIHKDSLKEFKGTYEQGKLKDKKFPATVFLLNPPYSTDGKGFVFVEKALSKMKNGKAAVLVQENAGSGYGLPYTKTLLKNNTLIASIHMSDIFCGKAGVQTAIYVFNVGTPHNEKQLVKFIDFSKDGYTRQNRKKSGQDVNLKNTDHALERYNEIVNLVLYGKSYLNYFTENDYIEDTITLNGNDWTFAQHKKIDTTPTKKDYRKTVSEYVSWKVNTLLNEDDNSLKIVSTSLKKLEDKFIKNGGTYKNKPLHELFDISGTKSLDEGKLTFINEGINFVGRVNDNNGIKGKIAKQAFEPNEAFTITATVIGNYKYVKYQIEPYYCSQNINKLVPKFNITDKVALYFVTLIQKFVSKYNGHQGGYKLSELQNHNICVPIINNEVDFNFIETYIRELEQECIKELSSYLSKHIK